MIINNLSKYILNIVVNIFNIILKNGNKIIQLFDCQEEINLDEIRADLVKKNLNLIEISFPRDDENAPRTKILSKECPAEFTAFRTVLSTNYYPSVSPP